MLHDEKKNIQLIETKCADGKIVENNKTCDCYKLYMLKHDSLKCIKIYTYIDIHKCVNDIHKYNVEICALDLTIKLFVLD